MNLVGLDRAEKIRHTTQTTGATFCEKSTCLFGKNLPDNEKSGGIHPKNRVNAAAKGL